MRRIAAAACAVALLGLGASGTASAASPGCFGHFVSSFAQTPPEGASNLGQFVSADARASVPFGQNNIPVYKSDACG
jgi:hypothetical protein